MKANKSARSRYAIQETRLCQFPYADGRRCRMLRHPSHASLCLYHARDERQFLAMDTIGEELSTLSGSFITVSDIHQVVGKLFQLVAQNRIPPRNAQILYRLARLLLHSQPGVRHEMNLALGYETWNNALREAYSSSQNAPQEQSDAPPDTAPVSPLPHSEKEMLEVFLKLTEPKNSGRAPDRAKTVSAQLLHEQERT